MGDIFKPPLPFFPLSYLTTFLSLKNDLLDISNICPWRSAARSSRCGPITPFIATVKYTHSMAFSCMSTRSFEAKQKEHLWRTQGEKEKKIIEKEKKKKAVARREGREQGRGGACSTPATNLSSVPQSYPVSVAHSLHALSSGFLPFLSLACLFSVTQPSFRLCSSGVWRDGTG
ncbi:hypothetical protein VTK26DRAFT_5283 [Humicola hyalothermophila]